MAFSWSGKTRGRAAAAARSQAEPGNEKQELTCANLAPDSPPPTTQHPLAATHQAPLTTRRAQAAAEVGLIFLLCFVLAGSPPPEVNETHYLAKAKHYWQPSWCAGDLFLISADAHLVFYWTFGWLTRWLSLSGTAIVGRAVTWLLLAWSWRRLSMAIVPRPWHALLSAAMFFTLVERFHMAGEWVVGGVEAKGPAFALVFLSLASLAAGRQRAAWLAAGGATAFHVLVGGWTLVMIAAVWLVHRDQRDSVARTAWSVIGAVILALPGLIPAAALSMGADHETLRLGNEIYVYDRLAHHLSVRRIWVDSHGWKVLRFVGLAVGWLVLARLARGHRGLAPIQTCVACACLLAAMGAAIDLATVGRQDLGAALLKFYWFRPADVMVPLGTALAVVAALARHDSVAPGPARWLLVLPMLLCAASVVAKHAELRRDFRPRAEIQHRSRIKRMEATPEANLRVFHDWRRACEWIAVHTPEDAIFLTPVNQQTFKWYASRAEVVAWKDMPQDPGSLVEWKRRLRRVFRDGPAYWSLASLGEETIVAICHDYSAEYVVLDRVNVSSELPLRRVYPAPGDENESFFVYHVPLGSRPETAR